MQLDERQENILDFIVRDYTRTACPVSSSMISAKKGVNLSPASVRNIMFELDEEGFLHQPHTSAGRVPTKKGYKYFVDNLTEERSVPLNIALAFDKVFSCDQGEDFFDRVTSLMAECSGLFSGILADGRTFKHGFAEVLHEPEFEERDFLLEFAEFADNIDKKIKEFEGVSIGNFSVVSSEFKPNKIAFFAGPQRMDYEKALSIINFITKNL